MATRNLSRTIIEGGRYASERWMQRKETKKERIAVKRHLHSVGNIAESYDAWIPFERRSWRPSQNDRLNPLKRFLTSHVGEYWNDVHALLHKRYDMRTIKGYHLIHDHAVGPLGYVDVDPTAYRWWRRFRNELYVDMEGVLRQHR